MEQKSQETKMLEYEIAENEVESTALQIRLLNARLADLHKFLASKEANAEKLATAAGLPGRIVKVDAPTQSEKNGNDRKEAAREVPIADPIKKTMEEPMEETIQQPIRESIDQPNGKPVKKTIEEPMDEQIENAVDGAVEKPIEQIVKEGNEMTETDGQPIIEKPFKEAEARVAEQREAVNSFDTLDTPIYDLDLPAQTMDGAYEPDQLNQSISNGHFDHQDQQPENDGQQGLLTSMSMPLSVDTERSVNSNVSTRVSSISNTTGNMLDLEYQMPIGEENAEEPKQEGTTSPKRFLSVAEAVKIRGRSNALINVETINATKQSAASEAIKESKTEVKKKALGKKRGAKSSKRSPQKKRARNDFDEEMEEHESTTARAPAPVDEDVDLSMTQPSTSTAGASYPAEIESPRIGRRGTTGNNSKQVFKKRQAPPSTESKKAKIQKKKEEEEEKVLAQLVQKAERVEEDEDGEFEEYVDEDEEEVEESKEEAKKRRDETIATFGRVMKTEKKKNEDKKIHPLEDMEDLDGESPRWSAKRCIQDELKKRGDSVDEKELETILKNLEELCPDPQNAATPGEKIVSLDSEDFHEERNKKIVAILEKVILKREEFDDIKNVLDKIPNSEKEKLKKMKTPTQLFCTALRFGKNVVIRGEEILKRAKDYLTAELENKANKVFASEYFKYARPNENTGYFVSKKNWFYVKKGFKNSGKPIKPRTVNKAQTKTNESKKAEQKKQKEQAPMEQDEKIDREEQVNREKEDQEEQKEQIKENQEEKEPNEEEKPADEESDEEIQEQEDSEEEQEEEKEQEPEETKEPSSSVTKSDAKEENLVEVIEVEEEFNHETLKNSVTSKDICIIRGLGEALGIDYSEFTLRDMERLRGKKYPVEILRQKPQHNTQNERMTKKTQKEIDSTKSNNNWEINNIKRTVTLEQFRVNYEKVQKVVKEGVDILLEKVRQNGKITKEDLMEFVRALRDCQLDLKTTSKEKKIEWNFPIISFGTNLDFSETEHKAFKKHYDELKKLPKFLHFDEGLLKYVKEIISGINCPQIYFKQPGSRTAAHIENQSLDSININLGPGDCVWFSVSYEYAGYMEELMCKKKVWPYATVYWPNEEDLKKAGIPYKKFVQKTGDLVYVGTGTIHWVQAEGFCANIAWNVAQESFKQLASALLIHDHNAEQKYATTLPIVPMIWEMAKKKAYIGSELEPVIQSVLVRTLFISKIEMERAKATKQCIVKMADADIIFDDVERCEKCKNVIFNTIIWEPKGNGKDQRMEQLCMKCATLNKSAVFYYRHDIDELVNYFDEYRQI